MRKNNQVFNTAEYIRLSKEDGDKEESDSVGNQKQLLAEYVASREYLLRYDVYIDDGYTGTNFNRPGFERMIKDIEAGRVNCVIVKDLSRFGRDYIDTGKYLERYFPEHQVRFISIVDGIDSFMQAYDMLLPIKNIFNEQYARDISKKVHTAMKTKQKAGQFIGAFASYGYKKSITNKNKLVVDDYAADVVRRIFSLYISGYGKVSISNKLNEEGIPCPSEYKKMGGENYRNSTRLQSTTYWTYSTINKILHNEMYIGNMVQGKTVRTMHGKARMIHKEEWNIVPNTHEAIIDKRTWEQVQGLLTHKTRNIDLEHNMSIFAGFLKCGDCGRAMVKKTKFDNKRGVRKLYYSCGTYVRSGKKFCTNHPTSHEVLLQVILDDLKTIICSIEDLEVFIQKQRNLEVSHKKLFVNEIQGMKMELERINKRKRVLYDDYAEDLISKQEYKTYRQDYLLKEELLKKQILNLEDRQKENKVEDIFQKPFIKQLLEMKNVKELDREVIVEMISKIRIFENEKIEITYNFSDELKHLFSSTYRFSQEES